MLRLYETKLEGVDMVTRRTKADAHAIRAARAACLAREGDGGSGKRRAVTAAWLRLVMCSATLVLRYIGSPEVRQKKKN